MWSQHALSILLVSIRWVESKSKEVAAANRWPSWRGGGGGGGGIGGEETLHLAQVGKKEKEPSDPIPTVCAADNREIPAVFSHSGGTEEEVGCCPKFLPACS